MHEPPVPSTAPDDPIVGMDLGTTNSLVAWCDHRGPRVLDSGGERVVRSALRIEPDGSVIVGEAARREAAIHPGRTVLGAKRLMGRGIAEAREAAPEAGHMLVEGVRGLAALRAGDRTLLPQEAGAHVLRRLRRIASEALGRDVRRAVITVPAYFDDGQREATRDAARLAGIDPVRIINEPTAAALAYGLGLRGDAETVAVYDFGGGTFDVSILELGGTGDDVVRVVSTAGDTRLGGDDIDERIGELLASRLPAAVRDSLGPSHRQALRDAAERAKVALGTSVSTEVCIALAGLGEWTVELGREEFETAIAAIVARTVECCRRAHADAGHPAIARVVMVGGSSRMPCVQRAATEAFGAPAYTAIDPDDAVALGAAVQAAVLEGRRGDLLLLDVIPLSLGIETVGGAVAKILVRNQSIPARATETFSTSVDGQVTVSIHVVQGEREMVADCRSLGRYLLRGIPPMPAGIPQILVEFMVDANGILTVSASERRSGAGMSIQVAPTWGLTRDEIAQMEREALAHAREDMHLHRVTDLAAHAALDLKWIREALARVGSVVGAPERVAIEDAMGRVESLVAQARSAPAAVDADAFHRAKEELDRLSVPVHEASITGTLREMARCEGPQVTVDGRRASAAAQEDP